jgi:hypothetical protein
MDYLDRIKQSKDYKHDQRLAFSKTLFERDILHNMLREDLWLDYSASLRNSNKSNMESRQALLWRAVRNATWSVDLWSALMQ